MAGEKFLKHNGSGLPMEVEATQTGGTGNENKIPALDGSGRIPATMMPTGVGADTDTIEASEALSAGDFVNVFNDGGTAKMRKADATTAGKEAHGFVTESIASAAAGTCYFEGNNGQVSGLTAGVQYLSATAGSSTSTPPSGSGNIVQRIGVASGATNLNFEAQMPVVLA